MKTNIKDTVDTEKELLPSTEIVESLIKLRDSLYKRIDNPEVRMLYLKINSCLYRRPDGSTIPKDSNEDVLPYLRERIETSEIQFQYNPNYGDDRVCKCGHTYYRHFDSYEDMYPIGCKYCGCYEFIEDTEHE